MILTGEKEVWGGNLPSAQMPRGPVWVGTRAAAVRMMIIGLRYGTKIVRLHFTGSTPSVGPAKNH